jgi:hypothetical protein
LYQEKIVTNWFNKEIDLESPLTQIGDNRRAQ